MSAPPDKIFELLHYLQSYICDVKAWATAKMLKHNDSKTELMLVTSIRTKHLHNLPTSVIIGNAQIHFKQSVKNFGFTLDCHLAINAHVSNISRTYYFEQRRLASIRRFLTSTATATHVYAFVLSRIDYCNSLLFGSTHLVSLHWLPIKARSTNNMARLCYHSLSNNTPSYVTYMLQNKPSHTRNTRSRNYTMPLLNRPEHSKTTYGDSLITFVSSSVWNYFPNDVMCAPSLSSFMSCLKTYFFV